MARMAVSFVAISGSLRAGSFNTRLAHAAAKAAGDAARVEVATIHGVRRTACCWSRPSTTARRRARSRTRQAPARWGAQQRGALRSAIDWMSRPSADIARVFGGLPTGVIGATPGPGMTRLAQVAWQPVLWRLGVVAFAGASVAIAHADKQLDQAATASQVDNYMAAFTAFVARHKRG
jgi:NAD(P)H-dependent FMN reductase